MQEREFDKLIDGDPAVRWLSALSPEQAKLPKIELKSEIELKQTDVPAGIKGEINDFISLLWGLNVKDREIRRRIKARFNIAVV